jgi:hypothetical protein
MKNRLASILTVSIALAGCASQKPSVGAMTTSSSPPSSKAQTAHSGWYLMQPPVHHGNPDSTARLADWQSIAFFDHPSQCDAARERGLSAYGSAIPGAGASTVDSVQLSQRLASSTQCVAADDPRINWFYIVWK